jgi:hypothetical protein
MSDKLKACFNAFAPFRYDQELVGLPPDDPRRQLLKNFYALRITPRWALTIKQHANEIALWDNSLTARERDALTCGLEAIKAERRHARYRGKFLYAPYSGPMTNQERLGRLHRNAKSHLNEGATQCARMVT